MAKILIQTNSGETFKEITVSSHTLRNSSNSLLSVSAIMQEVLKGLDALLDAEEEDEVKTDPNSLRTL